MSQLHDELLIYFIFPWLVEDVSDAVWLSSISQSWRRSVLHHLRSQCQNGYGVLNFTLNAKTDAMPVSLWQAFGTFIGETTVLMDGDSEVLQEAIENGYCPSLKSIASENLRLSEKLLDNIASLIRLDLSFCEDINDDDVSLCCMKLPNLVELLLSWTDVTGLGWLDDEAKIRPWRVLRLDATSVPLALIVALCCYEVTKMSLVELGFDIIHDEDNPIELRHLQHSISNCSSLRSLHVFGLNGGFYRKPNVEVAVPTTLAALHLASIKISHNFFYHSLKYCDNLVRLELPRARLLMSVEELRDMFQWLGSNPRLQWLDVSDARGQCDSSFLPAYFTALKTISPTPLRVLKLAEWRVTKDMLLSLLESSPNITFVDLMHTGVTTSMAILLYGLWSKGIRLPDSLGGRTLFLDRIHGAEEIMNEVADDFERLTDAYRDIRAMRHEPTHGVEVIDSFGNLMSSSCKEIKCTIISPANSKGHLAPNIGHSPPPFATV